jgi:hypothetical protein
MSFSLDLTVDHTPVNYGFANGITYLRGGPVFGEIDGLAAAGPSVSLIDYTNNYSGPPLPDGGIEVLVSNGLIGFVNGGFDSVAPFGYAEIVLGNQVAFADWNIVNTPEPSTVLLIGIGLLAVVLTTSLANVMRSRCRPA